MVLYDQAQTFSPQKPKYNSLFFSKLGRIESFEETFFSTSKSLFMKFLRTQYAALLGIILILLATVKHAFEVYVFVMFPEVEPSLLQMVYIAVMLIAIDYAVLLFTIHGNDYAAQTFAFFIFLVNLYAFWQHIPWMGWEVSILRYFPGLLFSAMFSYGLFYFTDVFSTLLHKENRLERLERENDEYLKRLSSLEKERDGQNEALNALSQEKEDLSNSIPTWKARRKYDQKQNNMRSYFPTFWSLKATWRNRLKP